MHFHVDEDGGAFIRGWLTPDNPLETPTFLVRVGLSKEVIVNATIERPDVKELGIHATGLVGFNIDLNVVPTLATEPDVEVLEAKTGTPIYGRFNPAKHVSQKVMQFDITSTPQTEFRREMKRHFALHYPAAERNSLETLMVIIHNRQAKSLFIDGNLSFNKYSGMLHDSAFKLAALCREPYEHLAETLLFLDALARADANLKNFFSDQIRKAATFAESLSMDDDKSISASLRQLPPDVNRLLSNPATRMLAGEQDEPVRFENVALALEHLATMDLVGTTRFYEHYQEGFSALIERPEITIARDVHPNISALGARLRRMGAAADLLEFDLMLYSLVDRSLARARKVEINQPQTM